MLHNRYQVRGGEDAAVELECAMLRGAGLTVDLLEVSNHEIAGTLQKIKTALQVSYSFPARRLVAARIRTFQPDVVHVHNFFPALSPSIYDACRRARVAVVQTLHNYRLVCANGLLFREGKPCTECLGRTLLLPAIRHNCYRDSKAGSAAVAAMIGVHRVRHTWAERVQRFIVLTEVARRLFATHADIPPEKIVVKQNAAADAGRGDGSGGFALYVGRLSPEKGIETLLAASDHLDMPLIVAGSGALQEMVETAQSPGKINFVGWQTKEAVLGLMRKARVLIVPSVWDEPFGLVVAEAFSAGLPVVASRIGALETLVEHEGNGLLFEPGNSAALAQAVRRIATNGTLESSMRERARASYDALYRPDVNARLLQGIYEQAIASVAGR